jgi:predicted glycosyltransferase
MKVMFVVTHLLGSGHLSRALTLARAFEKAGHSGHVVSGGMPVPHLRHDGLTLHQLPPLRSDGVDFTRLLDASGAGTGPEYLARRQSALTDLVVQEAPDVLITELFPFGRRSLRAEFTALLETAHGLARRPLVLASVRDILAPPSKPRKAVFAQDMIGQYYDGVLVHSDPALMPLDLSWPVDATLARALHYTGFVAPAPAGPHPASAGADEIIVSAGGGDVGDALFAAAKSAAAEDPQRTWRLLIGGQQAQDRIAALRRDAPPNLHVEAARPDFRQMLHHGAASVSMCGYNTAQDILQTSCPAVFIPFDAGNEVEQTIRARALSAIDGIEVLMSSEMTPVTLRDKVSAAIAAPHRPAAGRVDGAAQTVKITAQLREALR